MNLTVKTALLYMPGKTAAAGLISGHAAALAKGVLRAMFISKWTALATIVLGLGVAGTGTGLWTYHTLAAEQADAKAKKLAKPAVEREPRDTQDKKAAAPAVEPGEEPQPFIRVPSQHDGIVRVIGTEIKEGEKVPPGRLSPSRLVAR